jgi:hypothetical protein
VGDTICCFGWRAPGNTGGGCTIGDGLRLDGADVEGDRSRSMLVKRRLMHGNVVACQLSVAFQAENGNGCQQSGSRPENGSITDKAEETGTAEVDVSQH